MGILLETPPGFLHMATGLMLHLTLLQALHAGATIKPRQDASPAPMRPSAVRAHLKIPATGAEGMPVAERQPSLASRDHLLTSEALDPPHGDGPRRRTNKGPDPRRASPGPRRAPAPRPRRPREAAGGHPRLRHRKRRRLRRPGGLHCGGKGSRRAEA